MMEENMYFQIWDIGQRWDMYCNINDTMYDITIKKLNNLKTDKDPSFEDFNEYVFNEKLYYFNGDKVPLKIPFKRLFDLDKIKGIIVLMTKDKLKDYLTAFL